MHSNREHSKLGASGTSRWMKCPASVKNVEENPLPQGKAASDGTYTHEVAEQQLREAFDLPVEGPKLACEDDRQERVDMYVNTILDVSAELADKYGEDNVEVAIEDRFDLGYLDDRFFGTNDAAVWVDMAVLHVFDLKDGRGEVEAINNTQLMYYALGMIYKHQIDVNRVVLHIIQPRLGEDNGHKTWEVSLDTLTGFEHDLMKAADAVDENPDHAVPGESQCRWCNTATCPARQEQLQTEAALAFPEDDRELVLETDHLSTERLAQLLRHKDAFKDLFENVEETLYQRARNGEEVEGFKLVQALGNTTWIKPDESKEKILDYARVNNLEADDIYAPRKLKTPNQLKAKVDAKYVDDLTHRPNKGMKLVPNSARGKAIQIGFDKDLIEI